MPKTVFITSFHTLISRNILQTGLLEMLNKNEIRAVLLVPEAKKGYFLKEFAGGNILIEGVNTALTKKDSFFRQLALASSGAKDLYIKRRAKFYEDKNFFSFAAGSFLTFLLARKKIILKSIRYSDTAFGKSANLDQLLTKYKPDLVFSTDAQNEIDVRLLQLARKRGVKTLGMVRSWDNLTSKGVLRMLPDTLAVNNEVIKEEAIRYNFMDPAAISVVGIPHYDKYLIQPEISKEEFFSALGGSASGGQKLGFDPQKKLILFAPIGDRYIRNNETDKYVLEILSGLDANILVRIPPMDTVNFGGFKSKKAMVAFDDPGTSSWKGGKKLNEVGREDDDRLIASLSYSDVLVTGQSTVTIDAALFHKPAIIIGFEEKPKPYWESILRYYDYEYYKKFKETCALKFAKSPEELLEAAEKYLENPALGKETTEKIIKNYIYFVDGKSTERLSALISKLVF